MRTLSFMRPAAILGSVEGAQGTILRVPAKRLEIPQEHHVRVHVLGGVYDPGHKFVAERSDRI